MFLFNVAQLALNNTHTLK